MNQIWEPLKHSEGKIVYGIPKKNIYGDNGAALTARISMYKKIWKIIKLHASPSIWCLLIDLKFYLISLLLGVSD